MPCRSDATAFPYAFLSAGIAYGIRHGPATVAAQVRGQPAPRLVREAVCFVLLSLPGVTTTHPIAPCVTSSHSDTPPRVDSLGARRGQFVLPSSLYRARCVAGSLTLSTSDTAATLRRLFFYSSEIRILFIREARPLFTRYAFSTHWTTHR